jgi:hypothetical protein
VGKRPHLTVPSQGDEFNLSVIDQLSNENMLLSTSIVRFAFQPFNNSRLQRSHGFFPLNTG